MGPTVNNGLQQESDKRLVSNKKSDLVCRVKYCNNLPDIPFDLKFINYPFPTNRYVTYKPTSLEKNYKYEILTEHDLGIPINLIDPNAYEQHLPHMSPAPQNLHPDDEKLLEDDTQTPQAAKKSRHSHVNVSWLRRTEYISTELTRYQPQNNDKIEATVGFSRRKAKHLEDPAYTDRDSQLTAIGATFEAAKEPLNAHYSKPGVTAVEELPIFPDFDLWKYPCAQVIFDSDPAPLGRPVATAMEEMSQAMIRGVMDESGEQFVAYFLPTEETIKKRKRDVEDEVDYVDEEEYDYVMTREYNWNVKNKASKGYEENYFFIIRKDAVYYNELETRVRLNKRRQKPGSERTTSRLVVTHRPLTGHEHNTHRHREAMLQAIGDEEIEYEEEEEQLEGNDDDSAQGSDEERKSRSRSRSRSQSGSRSGSGNNSRSSSKSASRSRSRSRSASGSRSGSGSPAARRSRSRSSARSGSGSPRASRSRSASGSPIKSRSRSGSVDPARSGSGSPRSASRSSAGSGSPRSASGSPARSGSGSPARSGSGSPAARSGSGSPVARSGSGSPAARSGSGSPNRSGSESD